jgi:hypothetical protein
MLMAAMALWPCTAAPLRGAGRAACVSALPAALPQVAALQAAHARQQRELQERAEERLAQLQGAAAELGSALQQVAPLAQAVAQQNSMLQARLEAVGPGQQRLLEQQRLRIEQLEQQLLQVRGQQPCCSLQPPGSSAFRDAASASRPPPPPLPPPAVQLGERGRQACWSPAARAASRSPSPARGGCGGPASRPISAPQAATGGAGRQQPLQPLLEELSASKRREAALQSRVVGLAAQLRQARDSAAQQQAQGRQEREQLQRQLARESGAAAAAAKKLAAAQQQLQAAEGQEAARGRYVLQLERKLVQLHKEQQQLRQRLRAAEQQQAGQAAVVGAAERAPVARASTLTAPVAAAAAAAAQQEEQGWQLEPAIGGWPGSGGAGSVHAECGDCAAEAGTAAGGEDQEGQEGPFGGVEAWSDGRRTSVYAAAEAAWERPQQTAEGARQQGGGGSSGSGAAGLLAQQVEALQGGLRAFEEQLSLAMAGWGSAGAGGPSAL